MRREITVLVAGVLFATTALGQAPPAPCREIALTPLPADSVRPHVRTLLTDADDAARLSSARALGRPGAGRAPAGDDSGRLLEKDAQHALSIALSDTDDAVRVAAACAIGFRGDARALPFLDMRAAKASAAVRAAVDWATNRIRAAASAPLLLRNATVLDGTDAPPRPRTSILVVEGMITRVGQFGSFSVPAGTRVVDASGRWVTPGLWDMHVHLGKTGPEALPLLVAAGVTSVRDMGGDPAELFELRRRISSGDLLGPRLVIAGPMLESPAAMERLAGSATTEPYWRTRVAVQSPADAQRLVDSIAELGVDLIKVREAVDSATYRAIAAAARLRRVPLAGHAPFMLDPLEGARLGLVTFEHASYPYPLDTSRTARERLLRAFRDGGMAIVPTMVAWSSYLMNADSLALLIADSSGRRDQRRPLLSEALVQEWRTDLVGRRPLTEASLRGWCRFVTRSLEDLAAMSRAGVPILPGSDLAVVGLFPGWSLHDELRLLVRGDVLSPGEALRAATSQAARYAGRLDEVGTVREGQRADLLVLRADPTLDIAALRDLDAVVLGGVLLDRDHLAELRAHVPLDHTGRIDVLPGIQHGGCGVLGAV